MWSRRCLIALAGCGRFGFGGEGAVDGAADSGDGSDADVTYTCPAALDLCDTFEAPTIDTSVWTTEPGITLDKNVAHRGVQSLRVHMNPIVAGQDSYTTLDESATLAGPSTFWVRAWVRLSALPAPGNGMELIVAEQTVSGPMGDYIFIFDDGTHVYSQFESSSQITVPAPVGSWFCIVWKVVLSTSTNGSLELSGDFPTTLLANARTDGTTPVGQLAFGIGFSGTNVPVAQPALDVWFDDVIVHRAPLACAD